MEEPEVPTEHLHEEIQHHHEAHGLSWTLGVALTSAIVAGIAALASLLAGAHSNEAMNDQMEASNQRAYYQAKGIKANVLSSEIKLLAAFGKPAGPSETEKLAEYKKEQEEISKKAREKQEGSEHHLKVHEIMARSVTLSQIAIALSAVAVLTRRRPFWYLGLGCAAAGFAFLLQGLLLHGAAH